MKSAQKILALVLALVMAMGMMAGCAGNQNTDTTTEPKQTDTSTDTPQSSEPEVKELEHMDITISYWNCETSLAGDDIVDFIEDKFNVTFVPMNITWDDYQQKEQLWGATDSLPDIFAAALRDTGTFGNWAREGVIRALPDDLSAYPNLAKYMEGAAADGCKVDGKNYCIFRQTYYNQYETMKDRIIAYRWDLAQEAGITEEPQNWDEFRAMIKAIQAAAPAGNTVVGLTAPDAGYLWGPFFCYSMPNAVIGGATFKWVEQDGTYVPAYFAGENLGDDALPTWNLMRDMYKEGTIDKDIALSNLEQVKNKLINGQAAAVVLPAGSLGDLLKAYEEANGSSMEEDVRFLNLMPSVDGNTYYWAWDYAWSESMFSGNVDDAKMDRILMIYDYLLSDEGVMKGKFGNEGVSYQIVDGDIALIDNQGPTFYYPSCDVFGNIAAWRPVLPNGYTYPTTLPNWWVERLDTYAEQAKDLTIPESNPECITAFLALESDFSLHLTDDISLIITSDKPVEDVWNEIIEEYKADGLEDIIAQVNAAVK